MSHQDAAATAVPSKSCHSGASNIILLHCLSFNSMSTHFPGSSSLLLLLVSFPNRLQSRCCLSGFIFSFGFYSHSFGRFVAFFRLHHSVCTRVWEERNRSCSMKQGSVYFTALFTTFSHISPRCRWWEASLCPFRRGDRELLQLSSPRPDDNSESAGSLCSSSFLCIPSLVSLAPSRFLPPLNKSLASHGRDSSCCCLALIWCNDTHNAAALFFPIFSTKAESKFQAKLVHVGKGMSSVYSVFIAHEITFLQLFWRPPQKTSPQLLFSFGHFALSHR